VVEISEKDQSRNTCWAYSGVPS